MRQSQFFFVEFQEASEKPVEVLRVGKFVDMNLKPVEITSEDIDIFVANFEAGAAGQDVPIDIEHQKGEAGGWITKLERQGDKLLAWVDWNELGQKLVGEKVYKYLSATIDLSRKVLRAVSLVNFPAIKGLKPVELSEGVTVIENADLADGIPGSVTISQLLQFSIHKMFTNLADNLALAGYLSVEERIALSSAIGDSLKVLSTNIGESGARLVPTEPYYPDRYFADTNNTTSTIPAQVIQPDDKEPKKMDKKEKEELREQIRAEEKAKVEAELKERQKTEAELREQIRQEEAELAEARFKRRQGFIEFANEICNGDNVALSTKPEAIVELLEALPDEQIEPTKEILRAKVVDFRENGSGGDGQEKKPKLPDYARADILNDGLTVTQLFEANTLPGQMSDYELSEYTAEQIGA